MAISEGYISAVEAGIRPILADLPNAYSWRMPRVLPDGIALPEGANATEKVRSLKRQLHQVWKKSDKVQRIALANWYVRSWGGVRRLGDGLLHSFVDAGEALVHQNWSHVASWSKVLNLQDPSKYPIFDARVAAALNAIALRHPDANHPAAPILPSQNTFVRAFNQIHRRTIAARANRLTYPLYLDLLRGVVGRHPSADVEQVEMALFAFAKPANGPSQLTPG